MGVRVSSLTDLFALVRSRHPPKLSTSTAYGDSIYVFNQVRGLQRSLGCRRTGNHGFDPKESRVKSLSKKVSGSPEVIRKRGSKGLEREGHCARPPPRMRTKR